MPRPKTKVFKVALVDDHQLFRKAVSTIVVDPSFLEKNGFALEICLQAENGETFIGLLEAIEVPDLVILDIQMPLMDGFAVTKWLKAHYPEVKILILSMHSDPRIVSSIMKIGADGYLTKAAGSEEINNAIVSILKKGYYYSDFITSSLLQFIRNPDGSTSDDKSAERIELTGKELEMLKLSATDMTYQQIADRLDVSVRTVDGYRESLFAKFKVKSRTTLIMKAMKEGLLKL